MAKMVRPSELIPSPTLSDGETIPLLSEAEYETLLGSIHDHGILQPVLVSWPDKHIIDGHHRVRAALEVGLAEIPVVLDETHTEAQQEEIGIQMNAGRRHWTAESREKAIRKRLTKTPHRSSRDIAGTLCVDHKTVEKHRKEMESTGEIPHFDFRTDKRGSQRSGTVRHNVPSKRGIRRPPTPSEAERSPGKAPEGLGSPSTERGPNPEAPPPIESGERIDAPVSVPLVEETAHSGVGVDPIPAIPPAASKHTPSAFKVKTAIAGMLSDPTDADKAVLTGADREWFQAVNRWAQLWMLACPSSRSSAA